MFGFFQERALRKKEATELYEVAAIQARQPAFYAEMGVPDNIDGRFEMLTIHVGLFINQLNKMDKRDLAQSLFDVNFVTTDKALREIGVGDLSVPKHMKRMMKGFKGRIQSYVDALEKGDDKALKDAVRRNVFGTIEEPKMTHVDMVSEYVFDLWKLLKENNSKELKNINFPNLENYKLSAEKKSA